MADSKLTALTEITAPASADLVYVAIDPSGTPLSRKCTIQNLLANAVKIKSAQFSTTDTLDIAVIGTTETDFATTFSIPANFFTANKVLRATAVFQITTPASPATVILRGKLGSTVVYSNIATAPAAGVTNRGIGFQVYIQGTAAPGASVNVETGIVAAALNATVIQNNTAQPVAVATNGALPLKFSLQFGAATPTGATFTLRQLIVEEMN